MEMRKYGATATVDFPLIDAGAQDFNDTPATFAAADCQISKDGGAFANTTNSPAHEGQGSYSLVLTATEMQAARIVVHIIDAATKVWEDQAVHIVTMGHASALYAFDFDQATPAVNATQISGDATAANNLEADYDGTGYAKTASTIGTATAVTNGVNTTAISGDTTAANNLEAMLDGTGGVAFSTSNLATSANQTTILNRLGAWTGSGVNTVLGFAKAVLSKVATLPSDVGGTGSPATDSLEALEEALVAMDLKLPRAIPFVVDDAAFTPTQTEFRIVTALGGDDRINDMWCVFDAGTTLANHKPLAVLDYVDSTKHVTISGTGFDTAPADPETGFFVGRAAV